jgi:hypothetical protein
MRKVTANQVSNNWNGLLEVLEIKLVTRIPGQMSRGFGCSIVKMSQNLRRRWIEGSYVHEATYQVPNFYLIRVAILHVVISTRDESQASSVFNPKTQELDQQATCSNRCFDDGRVASGLGRRQSSAKSNMARRYGMPIERKFLITSGSRGSGTPFPVDAA